MPDAAAETKAAAEAKPAAETKVAADSKPAAETKPADDLAETSSTAALTAEKFKQMMKGLDKDGDGSVSKVWHRSEPAPTHTGAGPSACRAARMRMRTADDAKLTASPVATPVPLRRMSTRWRT